MAPKVQDQLELPTSISCMYCKATIFFPGLPAKRYMIHLCKLTINHDTLPGVDVSKCVVPSAYLMRLAPNFYASKTLLKSWP